MRIALTFDDGPGPWTAAILDLLAEHGAWATFFVLGSNVEGREAVLRRAVAEGHELGNHTFDHHDPRRLSDEELRAELERTGAVVRRAAGVDPRLARPPYGHDAERFARVAAGLGLETVLWTVDPRDWTEPPAKRLARRILRQARDGAIVDLHDGVPGRSLPGRSRQPTVDALALVLPELRRRGFELVTLSGERPHSAG